MNVKKKKKRKGGGRNTFYVLWILSIRVLQFYSMRVGVGAIGNRASTFFHREQRGTFVPIVVIKNFMILYREQGNK